MNFVFVDKHNQLIKSKSDFVYFTTPTFSIPHIGESVMLSCGKDSLLVKVIDVCYDFENSTADVKLNIDNSLKFNWEI
jgi:hypothetical protein